MIYKSFGYINSFAFLHSFSLRSPSSCVYRTVFYQSQLISSHSSVRLSRCDPAIDHLTKWLKLISRQMLFIAHMCECVCVSVSTCGAFGLGNCRCTLSLSLEQWCCLRFSQTHAVTAITSYENEAGVAALFGLTIAELPPIETLRSVGLGRESNNKLSWLIAVESSMKSGGNKR